MNEAQSYDQTRLYFEIPPAWECAVISYFIIRDECEANYEDSLIFSLEGLTVENTQELDVLSVFIDRRWNCKDQ